MAYRKVLVAKHSPKNLCFARQGEYLVPALSTDRMRGKLPKDDHFFVGVETGKASRYGWVKDLDTPITAEALARLRGEKTVDQKAIDLCELLLKSASKLPEDTPMACHFYEVTLPGRGQRKLKIHKVIFYDA
jgi:hypothetical protein